VQATYAQALEALGWKDGANERGRNAPLVFCPGAKNFKKVLKKLLTFQERDAIIHNVRR
jgi:hypothetical protein